MHHLFLLFLISFRLLFYNCENLLTSVGHLYEKLTNLTRVIVAAGDGQPPAVIGLAEVENDSIMTRWTTRTPLAKWHYKYIITDSPDTRGINIALMYQPDDFRMIGWNAVRVNMPKGIKPTRDILHAWGRIYGGDTLDVIVAHLPSRYGGKKASDQARRIAHQCLRALMDSVQQARERPNLIVMGDFNDYPDSKSMKSDFNGYNNLMFDLQKQLEKGKLEYGSHKYHGEWGFLDQIIVNDELLTRVSNSKAFALPFMFTQDEKRLGVRPKRSYYGMKYEGGYSDHFPVTVDFKVSQ